MRTILVLLLVSGVAIAEPIDAKRAARWEKEISTITRRLQAKPPDEGAIFFAGSSTIRLWDLPKSFPSLPVINVGFGGSEIRDSTHFAQRLILRHRPKTIVFYAGDNDVASGRKAGQVEADFREFCQVIHKDLPRCQILFLAIKPSLARWKQFEEQTRANEQVRKFCKSDPRLRYVDTVSLLLGSDGKPNPALYAKDGLHMSAAGYQKWTPVITDILNKP